MQGESDFPVPVPGRPGIIGALLGEEELDWSHT